MMCMGYCADLFMECSSVGSIPRNYLKLVTTKVDPLLLLHIGDDSDCLHLNIDMKLHRHDSCVTLTDDEHR